MRFAQIVPGFNSGTKAPGQEPPDFGGGSFSMLSESDLLPLKSPSQGTQARVGGSEKV